MAYIKWDDSLKIGIKQIDKQHKYFIGIMDRLFEALQTDEKDAVAKIIDELVVYAELHFATEQGYFTKYNYEGAKEHIAEHQKIKQKIEVFLANKDADPFKLGYSLLDLLEDWLFHHLEKMDKKYVKSLHEHGLR